jgi:hypothetical protein
LCLRRRCRPAVLFQNFIHVRRDRVGELELLTLPEHFHAVLDVAGECAVAAAACHQLPESRRSRPDPSGTYTRTMFVDITERVLMEQEKARLEACGFSAL